MPERPQTTTDFDLDKGRVSGGAESAGASIGDGRATSALPAISQDVL
jgi:hypothetical protein